MKSHIYNALLVLAGIVFFLQCGEFALAIKFILSNEDISAVENIVVLSLSVISLVTGLILLFTVIRELYSKKSSKKTMYTGPILIGTIIVHAAILSINFGRFGTHLDQFVELKMPTYTFAIFATVLVAVATRRLRY